MNPHVTRVEFTPSQVEQIQRAMREAEEDMREWRRRSIPTWQDWNTPLGPLV